MTIFEANPNLLELVLISSCISLFSWVLADGAISRSLQADLGFSLLIPLLRSLMQLLKVARHHLTLARTRTKYLLNKLIPPFHP